MQKAIWVVDIEASGLSPTSYPIEVGIVNGQREYQRLISPAQSWKHWSPKSEELHGIPRRQLYSEGTTPIEVAGELNSMLGDSTVFSDHGDWDSFWLQRLYDCVGIKQTFTLADITTLLDECQMRRFAITLDKLRKTGNYRAHRALDDARVIHSAVISAFTS
ncbi:3'-5' exonuclease [Porticoccus sp.]